MRNHVSHPYKTTGKFIILYILIYIFGEQMGRQKILNCMAATIL
jgi:hypothetical protein